MLSQRPTLTPDTLDLLLVLSADARSTDQIRLRIASALQRAPLADRWSILEILTSHPEDANDHNLPLMYWYAMEPLADVDPQRALALAMTAGENIPILREYMVRRLGSGKPEEAIKLLVDGLADAETDDVRLTFLKGDSQRTLWSRKDHATRKVGSDLRETFQARHDGCEFRCLFACTRFRRPIWESRGTAKAGRDRC